MGSLIMTGSLICFSDVEAACFEKEAFKRGYLWIWIKKGVANYDFDGFPIGLVKNRGSPVTI